MTTKSLIEFRKWCKTAIKKQSKWGFQRNIKLKSKCMKHVEAIERIENIKFDGTSMTLNTYKGYLYMKLRLEFMATPKFDKEFERNFNVTKNSVYESHIVSKKTSAGNMNWYPMREMEECRCAKQLKAIFDIFSKSKYIKTRFEEYNNMKKEKESILVPNCNENMAVEDEDE